MVLNKNNFIRWYNSTTVVTLDRALVEPFGICNPMPLWLPSDTMNIYFNAANNAAQTGTVSMINTAGTEVAANVGTLSNYTVVGGNHSKGVITCPALPQGLYRLKIGSLVSNLIRVVGAYTSDSATVTFSHNGNMLSSGGNYIYKDLDHVHRFRLPIIAYEMDYENTREVYEESTTRRIRANNQRTRKTIKFKASYLDDETLDALAWMLTHDNIQINGYAVTPKSGTFIEKDFDPLEKLNHAYFTMYEDGISIASIS